MSLFFIYEAVILVIFKDFKILPDYQVDNKFRFSVFLRDSGKILVNFKALENPATKLINLLLKK